jgi:hypothetical protein
VGLGVLGAGVCVVKIAHPKPLYTNSSTTVPSRLTVIFAGKLTPTGMVQVSRDRFVGFT